MRLAKSRVVYLPVANGLGAGKHETFVTPVVEVNVMHSVSLPGLETQ